MSRKFAYRGKTYEAGGERSEWVLRFWDDDGTDMGSTRNCAGLCADELSDEELCLHLVRALPGQAQGVFVAGGQLGLAHLSPMSVSGRVRRPRRV